MRRDTEKKEGFFSEGPDPSKAGDPGARPLFLFGDEISREATNCVCFGNIFLRHYGPSLHDGSRGEKAYNP